MINHKISLFTLLAAIMLTGFALSAAPDKDTFTVSITSNPALDASFHRKEKTKNRGWKIYIKFTNKTDKPIRSLGIDFEMLEGKWLIKDDRTHRSSSSPILMPKQSEVFGWIDGVPSSVDHIHIVNVETK